MIPFKIKLLTETAKPPHRNCESDLWDLYADDFCLQQLTDCNLSFQNPLIPLEKVIPLYSTKKGRHHIERTNAEIFPTNQQCLIHPQGRILVKTGISLELPKHYKTSPSCLEWSFEELNNPLNCYAVADIRPRSGLALKHGITVLNTPGTIDNSYRKEIGVILYNAGHEPYTITKGDKICQMLIRPLYPSKMEIVENIKNTGRGGFGSTGK